MGKRRRQSSDWMTHSAHLVQVKGGGDGKGP